MKPNLNFTIGPVMMHEEILAMGSQQIPYFRTKEFSQIMFENESLLKILTNASESARVITITGSGTASMEASVSNFFTKKDKILVINGGSFGERLVELCKIFELDYTEIKPAYGCTVTQEQLLPYANKSYTAFLCQHNETSTGVLYDLHMIGSFCKQNSLFLCVDCISSFLADPLDMCAMNINAMIIGSQKAIALPPGVSAIIADTSAVDRIKNSKVTSLYFNLKSYLLDMERGQTPFTPAVGIILQLHKQLQRIVAAGGASSYIKTVANNAHYFRKKSSHLPFTVFSNSLSNAVTPLATKKTHSAYSVFEILKDEYAIFVCPNGGSLRDTVFRVGHIGYIEQSDTDMLLQALNEMFAKGKLD